MQLVRVSPLPARTVVWKRAPSAWFVTVSCKATFELTPGEARLASDQLELNDEDEHADHDTGRSVYAPGDLAPGKAGADVVLVGSAFAPGGQPVQRLVARLIVAEINKSLAVDGWRAVGPDGAVQEGAPFTSMPITYEHAAGGPGTWNPVGVSPETHDSYGRRTLPNLHKKGQVPSPDALVDPIGYGPIARHWPDRQARLSLHEASFDLHNWRKEPLPEDFDLAYFNVAPADQQLAALKPDEAMVLENLHPEHARLISKLPGIQPAVFLVERGGERLPMVADTLWIDSDRGLATVTFRGRTQLSAPDEALRIVVGKEHISKPLEFKDVEGAVRSRGSKSHASTMSLRSIPDEATGIGIPMPRRDAPLPFMASGKEGLGRLPEDRPSRPDSALPFVPQQSGDPLASSSVGWASSAPPSSATTPSGPPAPPSSAQQPAARSISLPAPKAPPAALPRGPVAGSPWAGSASGGAAQGRRPEVPMIPLAANPLAQAQAAPAPASAPLPTPSPAAATANEVYALLWMDPESAPRVRRVKAFKPLLAALEERPVDWELDDAAPTQDPLELEDRREVFEVMARGQTVDGSAIRRALADGVRADGKLVPPLVLVSGDLLTPFDELERLKAIITTVTPLLVPVEEPPPAPEGAPPPKPPEVPELNLRVASAKEFLANVEPPCPPSVVDGFSRRIVEAFEADTDRALPDSYLDDETRRVLLENRKYQKRIVFGDDHLRTLAYIDGPGEPMPTYLPADLASKLPLYERFKVRILAEALTQEDQYESHPQCLRALALVRVLPPMRSR